MGLVSIRYEIIKFMQKKKCFMSYFLPLCLSLSVALSTFLLAFILFYFQVVGGPIRRTGREIQLFMEFLLGFSVYGATTTLLLRLLGTNPTKRVKWRHYQRLTADIIKFIMIIARFRMMPWLRYGATSNRRRILLQHVVKFLEDLELSMINHERMQL